MASRRQHFVPYFYLKEFSPGFVYRKGESSPRYTKKARNISVRKDYYGKSADDLIFPLDKMNSVIENEAAPIIDRLKDDVTTITRGDWITLSYFFANMQVRNPYYIESFRQTFRQLTNQVTEMAERMMQSYQKARAEGKEFHLPEEPNISGERKYSLEELKKSVEELDAPDGHIKIAEQSYYHIRDIASYIQQMSLHVIKAPGSHFFVTTDTPLVLYSLSSGTPLGAGWANRDAMAMIPIHPKYCFMLAYRGQPSIYSNILTPTDVHLWNVNLMKYASYEVYSKYLYDLALDWMLRRGLWGKKK